MPARPKTPAAPPPGSRPKPGAAGAPPSPASPPGRPSSTGTNPPYPAYQTTRTAISARPDPGQKTTHSPRTSTPKIISSRAAQPTENVSPKREHGAWRNVKTSGSPLTESNRRPSPYHGDALPTELRGQVLSCLTWYFAPAGGQLRSAQRSTGPALGFREPTVLVESCVLASGSNPSLSTIRSHTDDGTLSRPVGWNLASLTRHATWAAVMCTVLDAGLTEVSISGHPLGGQVFTIAPGSGIPCLAEPVMRGFPSSS